jgi:hypothetical protein
MGQNEAKLWSDAMIGTCICGRSRLQGNSTILVELVRILKHKANKSGRVRNVEAFSNAKRRSQGIRIPHYTIKTKEPERLEVNGAYMSGAGTKPTFPNSQRQFCMHVLCVCESQKFFQLVAYISTTDPTILRCNVYQHNGALQRTGFMEAYHDGSLP